MTLKFDSIEKEGNETKIVFRIEGTILSAAAFFEGATAGEQPTLLKAIDVHEFATMDHEHEQISYHERKSAAVAIIMHDVKIG